MFGRGGNNGDDGSGNPASPPQVPVIPPLRMFTVVRYNEARKVYDTVEIEAHQVDYAGGELAVQVLSLYHERVAVQTIRVFNSWYDVTCPPLDLDACDRQADEQRRRIITH